MIVLKTALKRPFLDTKSAVERARRLKTQRNLFVVMRIRSPIGWSYLDAGFEPQCGHKDFWTFCCLLLAAAAVAAKTCCSALDPKRWLPSWVYLVEVLHHLLGSKDELHVLAGNSKQQQQAVKKSLRPHRGSKPAAK